MKKSILLLSLMVSFSSHAQLFRRFRPSQSNVCLTNTTAMLADGKLEIDIFLGYYDNSPGDWVVNFRERSEIVRELTKRCINDGLCDFIMNPADRNRFTKNVSINEKPVLVSVTIHNSAVMEYTSYNQTQRQRDLSRQTEANFHDRVRNGEAVFYLGHSRYGGGPDFNTPVLDPNYQVDEQYYRSQKPGYKLLQNALQGGGAKLFGAFSCESIEYFSKMVRRSAPNTVFMGTTLTPPYEDNMAAFYSALGNTIDGECDYNDDFSRAGLPARVVQ